MSTEPTVQTGTRGTAYTYQDADLTEEVLTIDTYRNLPVFIDEADRAQQTYLGAMEIAEFQGEKISEYLEAQFLAQHSSFTDFGLTDLNGGAADDTTEITVSPANIDDIIRAIKRKQNANNLVNKAVKFGRYIVWRAVDFEMLEAFVQAGIKSRGLVKFLLINGENLRRKAMATLSKQATGVAVQLQRLSVETPFLGEATVRTA